MFNKLRSVIVIIPMLLSSCKSVNLSTYESPIDSSLESTTKGHFLLDQSFIAMGYEKFSEISVYEADVIYNWNTFWLLGTKNPFRFSNEKHLNLKLETNTFDSQLTYLEGKREGIIFGVQDKEVYLAELNSSYIKEINSKRKVWDLVSNHMFLEIPLRFEEADAVRYLGNRELNDTSYELVFLSFKTGFFGTNEICFLAFLNETSKFLEILEFSVGESFIKVPKKMRYGFVRFERDQSELGVYLPTKITFQHKLSKRINNYQYVLNIGHYKFNSFDVNELKRIKDSK